MMKINSIFLLSLSLLCSPIISEHPTSIGEETILPLKYPKFSLMADYGLKRSFHGFDDVKLREKLSASYNAFLSFEAGLYKYLNAGAAIGFNAPAFRKNEPLHIRLLLFAKPYVALGERVALFARLGGGISSALSGSSIKGHFMKVGSNSIKAELLRVYKDGSYDLAYGAITQASIGIEYFPFTRVGISLEGGIRSEFFRANKDMYGNSSTEAPAALNYMIYEFPIGLTLHIII